MFVHVCAKLCPWPHPLATPIAKRMLRMSDSESGCFVFIASFWALRIKPLDFSCGQLAADRYVNLASLNNWTSAVAKKLSCKFATQAHHSLSLFLSEEGAKPSASWLRSVPQARLPKKMFGVAGWQWRIWLSRPCIDQWRDEHSGLYMGRPASGGLILLPTFGVKGRY